MADGLGATGTSLRSQVVVSTTLLFPTRVLLEDVDMDGDEDAILVTAYSALWYVIASFT